VRALNQQSVRQLSVEFIPTTLGVYTADTPALKAFYIALISQLIIGVGVALAVPCTARRPVRVICLTVSSFALQTISSTGALNKGLFQPVNKSVSQSVDLFT